MSSTFRHLQINEISRKMGSSVVQIPLRWSTGSVRVPLQRLRLGGPFPLVNSFHFTWGVKQLDNDLKATINDMN